MIQKVANHAWQLDELNLDARNHQLYLKIFSESFIHIRGVHTRPEPDPSPTRPESQVRSG